jgi:TetR/AcrR family transcriptional regulator, transcriptional repressor for nem operon
MARVKEFDRDTALQRAMHVFWACGYVSASTDDLLKAMKIGRQSLYDTFGDKRSLYLAAFDRYLQQRIAENVTRLRSGDTPLAGIRSLVTGVYRSDLSAQAKGCMGVGAIAEFGVRDKDVVRLRNAHGAVQHRALIERLSEARKAGEIPRATDIESAAQFVLTTMFGLQVAARAGASLRALDDTASFALERLQSS